MSQNEMKTSSPTPSSASTPDVINRAATKLCHIVKRPDFDGYGFNLHSEKAKPGQFIGKVDANSPAEAAGLKEGDRIIEVNGVAINSETHKQVVQRIKAISCEVRLLLVDVEGKGDGMLYNGQQQQQQSNGKTAAMESTKTEQVLPGASENINSITMVSTKRPSQESQRSSAQVSNNNNISMDVTDKAVSVPDQAVMMNNNNNNIPPPPSAMMATSPSKTMSMMNNNMSNNSSNSNSTLSNSNGSHTEMASAAPTPTATGSASGNGSTTTTTTPTIKAGSLQLNMTAAEMRAKLMMKKKYDPKNESVDLKKKYEIVQKL